MKLSIQLKSAYAKAVFFSGAISRKLAKNNRSDTFLILMYHRITHPEKTIQSGMYVTPDTFERHLQYLNERFTVLSLKELLAILTDKKDSCFEKPVCVITFDDGWKDFYDYAFPLLCKYNLPATVFLPTAYIGTNNKFWTDVFANLLLLKQNISSGLKIESEFTETIDRLGNLHGNYEDKLEQGIEILKKLPRVKIVRILDEISKIWNVNEVVDERDFINWPEVEEMKASELISYGSHTVSHEILTTIAENDVRNELVDSRNELLEKEIMDHSCQSFCYPNGGFTAEITDIVRDSGYHIAVTTKDGWNQRDENIVALNRVGIHQDMTSTIPLFASRIAGFI